MYRDVHFRMQPMEWLEEDLKELHRTTTHAKTIQLLSAMVGFAYIIDY